MNRLRSVVLLAATAPLILVPWAAASAQQARTVQFGGTAGLNVPLSDLSRQTQTGLRLDGFLTGTPRQWPVTLRGELSYSSFPGTLDRASQHITGFAVNASWPAFTERTGPYLLGGLGLYTIGSYAGRASENDVGVDVGLGYRWRRPGVSYFTEVRFTDVAHTGASRQMMPIAFGVIF